MDVLSAAVPDMVWIDHFRASSEFLVRWSSLSWLQRYLGTHGYHSSITAVPDPDSSHSRLSFALEHRAQCFPGHSRMLPGVCGGKSCFPYPGPCCNLRPYPGLTLHFTPKELFAECDMVNVDWWKWNYSGAESPGRSVAEYLDYQVCLLLAWEGSFWRGWFKISRSFL